MSFLEEEIKIRVNIKWYGFLTPKKVKSSKTAPVDKW